MRIIKLKECLSTQYVAKKLAETETEDLTIICANQQTEGIGRKGNIWESPYGGLWMTIILKRQIDAHNIPYIALSSGIAIHDVLMKFGVPTRIKYPNDLLAEIDGELKKLGGILCQSCIIGDKLKYLLIGIGLNVNNMTPKFGVSLKQLTDHNYDLDKLMIQITQTISESIFNLIKDGKKQLFLKLSRLGCLDIPP